MGSTALATFIHILELYKTTQRKGSYTTYLDKKEVVSRINEGNIDFRISYYYLTKIILQAIAKIKAKGNGNGSKAIPILMTSLHRSTMRLIKKQRSKGEKSRTKMPIQPYQVWNYIPQP